MDTVVELPPHSIPIYPMVNTIGVDALATQWATASAAMVSA